ncbi:MAG: Uma2 family endonuclease [candidate division KSB1 bacterium]
MSTPKLLSTTHGYVDEYLPEGDGKPMAETDIHRKQMIALLEGLEEYFLNDDAVYVTGNIFLYPPRKRKGEEPRPVSPDIFVVKGIAKKERRIYNMEVEGKGPDLVIELVSPSTEVEDLGNKRAIYAKLGVREYFLFDPLKEVFGAQLRGYRLEGEEYRPMMGHRLHSEVLGLDLVIERNLLRLYDPQTGERLRIHQEAEADRRKAETKAYQAEARAAQEYETRRVAEERVTYEAEARRVVEAENERLRQELARLQQQINPTE